MTASELIQKLILGEIKLSQGMMLTKVFFGNNLKSESLQWICFELNHYNDPSFLPDYRIIDCDIVAQVFLPFQGVKEEILDTSAINNSLADTERAFASPNKMLICQGLESIEKTLETSGRYVVMDLHKEQIKLMMQYYSIPQGCKLEKMYQQARVEHLKSIIPAVRNKLIDLLQAELLPTFDSLSITAATKKKIFISYGWEDTAHKLWVQALAKLLSEHFDVTIDAKVPFGTDLNLFMEQMISSADRVLLILTPTYKQKADNRQNGVGYESVLISSELYKNQASNKFIPIIRKGNVDESYPYYLGNRKGIFMTKDEDYEAVLESLIEDIKTN